MQQSLFIIRYLITHFVECVLGIFSFLFQLVKLLFGSIPIILFCSSIQIEVHIFEKIWESNSKNRKNRRKCEAIQSGKKESTFNPIFEI